MTESQYSHYKALPREELGIMANQLWREDPKMLGIHLARYKFVAKMLAGKDRVAEIGCGDGWFSRLVLNEVQILDHYDLDSTMAGEYLVQQRDITVGGALRWHNYDGKYDAIYSLDCFEHISPDNIDAALKNVCASLEEDGVFICGMPSLESQTYASEASKIGHVNCMSGEQLRKLMQRYFKQCFLFTMNDEQIGMGFEKMAHYLLILCVGVGEFAITNTSLGLLHA